MRLSRNLGIEADRGEDEEGIQIVIPSFSADDTHVVLLDVVAEAPGPVADVSVRYKDLVNLKNGVSRANLSIRQSEANLGALELNVIKNFLAFKLSHTLDAAGRLLADGNARQAAQLTSSHQMLLAGLIQRIPGFERGCRS